MTKPSGDEGMVDTKPPTGERSTNTPEVEKLLRAAQSETPRAELAARVLENLAYRTRLEGDAANAGTKGGVASSDAAKENDGSPPSRPTPLFAGPVGAGLLGATLLAAAAGLLLWLRVATPETTVELAREPVQDEPPNEVAMGEPSSKKSTPPPPDPCVAALVADGRMPLIDDFEDGDDLILKNEGRVGPWRWVRDTDAPGTAPALLPVPRPGASTQNQLALHVKGGRLREWGATVEFVFDPTCYDASAYTGIAFDARGTVRIYVAPREVSVMPVAAGGLCEEDCHNNHVAQVELDDDWKSYEVGFDQVEQRGYDRPALNPKRLHSLAFLIRPEDTPYDVWIDNVRFVQR